MNRSLMIALLSASLPLVAATTEVAGDRVWFHCESSTPWTNLEAAAGSWSDEVPPGSMQDGTGGCFNLDTVVNGSEPGDGRVDAVWEGQYDGRVRDLVVHAYVGSTSVSHHASGAAVFVNLLVVVDGEVVYDNGDDLLALWSNGPGPFPGTALVEAHLPDLDIPVGLHDIQLTMTTGYTNVPTFFLYGSQDAPAGITFNPVDGASVRPD